MTDWLAGILPTLFKVWKAGRILENNWAGKYFTLNWKLFQVSVDSLAADVGLKPNDFLNSIAGKEVFGMTHDEVSNNSFRNQTILYFFWTLVVIYTENIGAIFWEYRKYLFFKSE